MIVVTGAAGFIGSCLVGELNAAGFFDIVLVDDFSNNLKSENLSGKKYTQKVNRNELESWLNAHHRFVQFIFHIGARTDTAETDTQIFEILNVNYSKMVWRKCVEFGFPLVYASSAATYGGGEYGYSDSHDLVSKLVPLNPYGDSKNEFDLWALSQQQKPFFWAGLKFFNVYGPNEYHKHRMASVVYHAFHQISLNGKMKLFRSHKAGYKDGEQLRDFVYVKDVVKVCMFLMELRKNSGVYNLGSGQARTFIDLVRNVFHAMNVEESVEFIDTPADIRDNYQYFTEADMAKMKSIGYIDKFHSLEDGVGDYVRNFLMVNKYF